MMIVSSLGQTLVDGNYQKNTTYRSLNHPFLPLSLLAV
jgi:hypothetical protein